MKISIFGLGYVGTVSLACLARDGHDLIGVDIDAQKLELINAGKTPVVEEGMVELMERVVRSKRARATHSVEEAVLQSEISFVCVGTPSATNGSQDQSAILEISRQIGRILATKSSRHTIVYRSTVAPGTILDVVTPLIEEHSRKKAGRDFSIAFQPEFLREGSSIRDYDAPPITIVGTESDEAEALLRQIYGHLPCEFLRTSIQTAEMVKYCCNNFHALKITFANETARVCHSLGVDPFEVMDLVCRDTQLNISKAYMKPGFAFGGSCLPKDLRATSYIAKSRDVSIPMLDAVLKSNEAHLDLAYERIVRSDCRRVGIIGLSFKTGTDDLRESPSVELAERLLGKGYEVTIYDPEVSLSRLLGANKSFIEKHIPHLGKLLTADLSRLIADSELLVVGLRDAKIFETIYRDADASKTVLDLVGMPNSQLVKAAYTGLCW
jgi:GDP-mannose 6-dehydrogenase